MVRKLTFAAAALVAVVFAGVAGARTGATPGVTANEIVLGGTVPLSGEAASGGNVARGAEAYFKYVNARGGVNGRKITFKYLDDGYDPSRTVQSVRQLVQQDNVFAIFGSLGTSQNLAIRDFLNAAQVPQLFVNAGATTLGADYKRYPWTIGYIPTYKAEGEIYARYIRQNMPKAKIGVLYQNDDYGKDLLGGLRKGLGARASQIVDTESYEPTATDVQSQVAALKASGANVFAIFAFGKFSVQAFNYAGQLGWKPQIFVNDVSASAPLMSFAPKRTAEGALSIVFLKDPASPKWAKDPGIALFRKVLRAYSKSADLKDGYYTAGMASAFTLVGALKKAGKNLTRAGMMKAVTSLNETNNPFLLPGIKVKTSSTYRFPVSQVQVQRWSNGRWQLVGGLVSARP